MPQIGKSKHEKVLRAKVLELESKGYRVIRLNGKSPDAIAIKNNKVFAVEAEGISRRSREGKHGRILNGSNSYHVNAKRKTLSMFDGVIFAIFKRTPTPTFPLQHFHRPLSLFVNLEIE